MVQYIVPTCKIFRFWSQIRCYVIINQWDHISNFLDDRRCALVCDINQNQIWSVPFEIVALENRFKFMFPLFEWTLKMVSLVSIWTGKMWFSQHSGMYQRYKLEKDKLLKITHSVVATSQNMRKIYWDNNYNPIWCQIVENMPQVSTSYLSCVMNNKATNFMIYSILVTATEKWPLQKQPWRPNPTTYQAETFQASMYGP